MDPSEEPDEPRATPTVETVVPFGPALVPVMESDAEDERPEPV